MFCTAGGPIRVGWNSWRPVCDCEEVFTWTLTQLLFILSTFCWLQRQFNGSAAAVERTGSIRVAKQSETRQIQFCQQQAPGFCAVFGYTLLTIDRRAVKGTGVLPTPWLLLQLPAPQTGHQNFGGGGGRDPMDGFCNVYLIKWRQRQGDGKGIIDWRLPQDWQFTIHTHLRHTYSIVYGW